MEGHENETLVVILSDNLNKTRLSEDSIQANAYLKDTRVDELFLEVKDFFF